MPERYPKTRRAVYPLFAFPLRRAVVLGSVPRIVAFLARIFDLKLLCHPIKISYL